MTSWTSEVVGGRHCGFRIVFERDDQRATMGFDRSRDFIRVLWGREETDEATRSFRTGYGDGDLGPDRCGLLGVSVLATTESVLGFDVGLVGFGWPYHDLAIAAVRIVLQARAVGLDGDASIRRSNLAVCTWGVVRSGALGPIPCRGLLLCLVSLSDF